MHAAKVYILRYHRYNLTYFNINILSYLKLNIHSFFLLLVCFKRFEDENEYFKICSECSRRVCEDCSASYGNTEDDKNKVNLEQLGNYCMYAKFR